MLEPRSNMPTSAGCRSHAADVGIATTFGPNMPASFKVWTGKAEETA